MKSTKIRMAAMALATSAILLQSLPASATEWWPYRVSKVTTGKPEVVNYVPLARASKPYKICALFPHLKDSLWLAVNYGMVDDAKRLGIALNVFEAGGYENLPKQLAQFDDCMAGGYDAIVLGAISEGGLAQKLREADAAKIPVVAVENIITKAKLAGRVYPELSEKTKMSATYIAESLKGRKGKVVILPGPAGSGWAELYVKGLKENLAAYPNIQVIGERYGDAGVSVQLGLLQDALQAYPEMNVLYGGAPAIEAADGALQVAGRNDILLVPAYDNDGVHKLVKAGRIGAMVSENSVGQGRIALDMAVRALERKLEMTFVYPEITLITSKQLNAMDLTKGIAAPKGFSATYSVKAR